MPAQFGGRGTFSRSGGCWRHHVHQPDIHIRLTSHPGIGLGEPFPTYPLGRRDRLQRDPVIATPNAGRTATPWARTAAASFDLPGAGDFVEAMAAETRPELHQHLSGGADPARTRNGMSRARSSALSTPGATGSPRISRPRSRGAWISARPSPSPGRASTCRRSTRPIAKRPAKGRRRGSAESGDVAVTKAAIDPVWHLPGIAERFEVDETQLRRTLFEQTGGMYPELVTRPDIKVFLLPIGGITRSTCSATRPHRRPALHAHPARVHTTSTANGSGVFEEFPTSCTACSYLTHGIEEAPTRRAPAERRHGADRLPPAQGGVRALRRGHPVPGLQRPQALAGGVKPGGDLLPERTKQMRGGRAGRALPAADARHHPLCWASAGSTASSRCRT